MPRPRSGVLRSAALAAASLFVGGPASAGGGDVDSVFFVAKSENKNEVHYGVHLEAGCAPAGAAPVYAYWRMLERGPTATEPLLSIEQPAYGIASQRIVSRGEGGGKVVIALRAVPDRAVTVTTWRSGSSCAASAETTIAGGPAVLTRVFVQLRWLFGVQSLTLDGYAVADRHAVRERISR